MNNQKDSQFLNQQCPFYWKEKATNSSFLGRIMDEKTRKCIVPRVENYQEGEPGCVYHGSPPPVCFCQGQYISLDMIKVGDWLWECPRCQKQKKGQKDRNGYNDYYEIKEDVSNK